MKNTAASFGFEWTKFHDIFAAYEDNFLSYIDVSRESFVGKLVLDAGCGAGRHAYFASKYGARVVAFDLSSAAVEVARRNLPTAEVMQCDIYSFSYPERFDCVMCIGVLHHLPYPQKAFDHLVSLLKPGGTVLIWVYSRTGNRLARYLYEPLRRITTRIPHRILLCLSLPAAGILEVMNRLRLPWFRHYSRFPFKTKWNDVFDVFSAPSSAYYTIEDVMGWYEGAKLEDVNVSYRILSGAVKGVKGYGVR